MYCLLHNGKDGTTMVAEWARASVQNQIVHTQNPGYLC